MNMAMRKSTLKELKKCPACKSGNIYKRVRTVQFVRNARKGNKNFVEIRIKAYRCNKCKNEFDSPIVEQITLSNVVKI